MPGVRPIRDLKLRIVAACVLDPDGLRVQWLEAIAHPDELADLRETTQGLEADGLLRFEPAKGALVATADGEALAREAALEPDEIRDLHAQLASGIARSSYHAATAQDRLARHLEAAGDGSRAAAVLRARARRAIRTSRPHDALDALERASQLEELGPRDAVLRASSAKYVGDARAAAFWRASDEAAAVVDDRQVLARARVELVLAGEEEPDTLADLAPDDAGWVSYAAAMREYFAGDWSAAIDRGQAALGEVRLVDDPDLEAAILRLLANAHASLGHLDLAASMLQEVIEMADVASEPFGISIGYQSLVETLIEALDTHRAIDVAARAEQYVRTRAIDRLLPMTIAMRAICEGVAGHHRTAREHLRRLVGARDRDVVGATASDTYASLIVAECLVAAGDARDATMTNAALDQVEHLAGQFGFASYQSRIDLLRAWVALRVGDADALIELANRIDGHAEAADAAQAALLLARDAAWRSTQVPPVVARLRSRSSTDGAYAALAWREVEAIQQGDAAALDGVARGWEQAGRDWDAACVQLARSVLEQGEARVEAALGALAAFLSCDAPHEASIARSTLQEASNALVDSSGLLGCAAFEHVAPQVLVSLVRDALRIEVGSGDAIDPPDADAGILVVESGIVFAASSPADDAPILWTLGPGDAFVEAWYRSSPVVPSDAPTSLQAGSDVVAWHVPAATVRSACVSDPRLVGVLMSIADEHAADVRSLAHDLATRGFRERLVRLLLRLVERHGRPTLQGDVVIDAVFTNAQLARMCGSQQARVATLMAGWKRDGMLATWKRRIVVVELPRLRAELDGHDSTTPD